MKIEKLGQDVDGTEDIDDDKIDSILRIFGVSLKVLSDLDGFVDQSNIQRGRMGTPAIEDINTYKDRTVKEVSGRMSVSLAELKGLLGK